MHPLRSPGQTRAAGGRPPRAWPGRASRPRRSPPAPHGPAPGARRSPAPTASIACSTGGAGRGLAQRVEGDRAQRAVEVVAQGQPGQRVPAVAARQRAHRGQRPVEAQVLGQRVVQRGDLGRVARLPVALGQLDQLDDVEQPEARTSAPADRAAQLGGHARRRAAPARRSAATSRLAPAQQLGQPVAQLARSRPANRVISAPTASGCGRLVRNQRDARSSSRRESSTIRVGHRGRDRRGARSRAHSAGRSNTAVVTA